MSEWEVRIESEDLWRRVVTASPKDAAVAAVKAMDTRDVDLIQSGICQLLVRVRVAGGGRDDWMEYRVKATLQFDAEELS